MIRSMNTEQIITRFSLCLLAWCMLAVAPTFAQTITHVQLFLFELDDDDVFVQFGASVSGVGDVNGDGFDDLIVGAPSSVQSSSAQVFSGSDGSVLYTFSSGSDRFGQSVSGVGDVNGDEVPDFIVGARDGGSGTSGSVHVFSGADGSVLYNVDGAPDERLGDFVSGLGDVNGDGVPDFIVGAPGADVGGGVRVFSGANGTVLYRVDGGEAANDGFGASVRDVGDVNGDGAPDFVVGATGDDSNGVDSGNARVFSGVDGSVLYNFDGDSEGDGFGGSVSGVGDVNGDGVPDIAVGARLADIGYVRVFSGVDGSVLYNFEGDSEGDGFGDSVSGVGDVNGDGVPDFIVGASFPDVRVFSGFDGSLIYQFDRGGSRFDDTVSGVGDVNGDGVPDFTIAGSDRFTGGFVRVFVSQITILGDVNLDSAVNFFDIQPFIAVLSNQGFQPEADIDENGVVDFFDIQPFIEILSGP